MYNSTIKLLLLGLLALGITSQCRQDRRVNDDNVPAFQYSGLQLSRTRIPMGGLGTGNLLIGGRGDISYFEIFNKPNRTRRPYKTFFSLWVKKEGEEPVAKLLEGELLPPYDQSTHMYVSGLPRFQDVALHNTYPIPKWIFNDEDIPLDVELEVFNPFVPGSLDKSSYPVVEFMWKIRNEGTRPVQTSIALNIENPIEGDCLVNSYYQQKQLKGLTFGSLGETDTNFKGSMVAATEGENVQVQTHWYPGKWRDDAHILWDEFSKEGEISPSIDTWYSKYKPVSYNETSDRNGTILVRLELDPGEETRIPFYIGWYFPERVFSMAETFGIDEAADKIFRNYYGDLFRSAEDVLEDFTSKRDDLFRLTQDFRDAIYTSSYPPYVIEALMTQSATLKTNLIQITSEGHVHGFEGVGINGWCCPGTCTHVWNYEQALASLFPELERSMRNIEFLHDTFENGFQTHRSVLPLGDYWFNGPVAADGQMGSIIRVYREWKLSGDNDWLRSIWPKVKKALEFAWYGPGEIKDEKFSFQRSQTAWDPDKTGVMTGRQHNTYDISFFGPNSMTSSLYIGALKACAEMAKAMEEPEKAEEYQAVFENGVVRMESELWNGEYFIQIITDDPEADEQAEYELSPENTDGQVIPKYQYGDGCLADQLLGQYIAHIAGLGFLLDRNKVDDAIYAVYEHNFIRELRDFDNVQRVYGLNDESGVVLCTWPQGNRPLLPFVYADEIWSGVEYQVAATLIYSGFIDEGLQVVKAIQDRHDGFKRNPFEHDESGVHYARALASWSVLLALSGMEYDGIEKSIAFSPQLDPSDFTTFWSVGSGWGRFSISDKKAVIKVLYGSLDLDSFSIGKGKKIRASNFEGTITNEAGRSTVYFNETINLATNEELEFDLN
jgi:uncharacterized protein (DUF608 family)